MSLKKQTTVNQTAVEAEGTSTSIEEQMASSEEIAAAVNALAELGMRLQKQVKKFNL